MRYLYLIIALVIGANASADRIVDCDSLDPGVWNDDAMICARQAMYKPKLEYDALAERVRKILQKHIDDGRDFGWGVSARVALEQFDLAEKAWLELIEMDCNVETVSPATAGGTIAGMVGESCIMDAHRERNRYLDRIARIWGEGRKVQDMH